jgi:hypothetical protein
MRWLLFLLLAAGLTPILAHGCHKNDEDLLTGSGFGVRSSEFRAPESALNFEPRTVNLERE